MSERTSKNNAIEIRSKQTTNIVLMLSSTYFAQSHFQNLLCQLRVERKSLESQSSILTVVLLRGSRNWCLYCSYLRCYLSNEVAYFFVVREPNLLFSRGQLLAYQGIKIGRSSEIRTHTTQHLKLLTLPKLVYRSMHLL